MAESRLYKKGDAVKVWSLQSFHGGGFLKGREGIVSQDQTSGSVLVAVERKISGEDIVDTSYEVYPEQLRLISAVSKGKTFLQRFGDLIEEIRESN